MVGKRQPEEYDQEGGRAHERSAQHHPALARVKVQAPERIETPGQSFHRSCQLG